MSTSTPTRSGPAESPPFYRPDTYRPDESVAYLMRRILTTIGAEVEHELEPSGLTNAQWVPLFKLYTGTASTVAELARECELDTGAMTRTLDRLEAKGLLRRVRSSQDRRVVNLELTAEGQAAAREIPAVLCRVQNAYMRGFSVQEWQLLKGLLRRMLETALAIQAERGQTKNEE
ncbi:MAG TPA: MarR family transcriptional regulator [Ramlibacter sp.]|nr:MarR family transcriptional regulator [Ramlibacter sp.]